MPTEGVSNSSARARRAKQHVAMCKARIQMFLSLSLPMRLTYAMDRTHYALACDEEACLHYGDKRSLLSRMVLALKAYTFAVATPELPSWFVEDWFVTVCATPIEGTRQPPHK